ncbi:aminodeoxychorismate synthase component I [Candidatus Thioglobus sp. NP1]|uniref:aminodeoxychorismate synthase component I n=1 Tax=Candidatus Thioglobus sp. NP1 TaxID=2508687 RepID=UPI000DEDCA48|nr:aminodeoxychorismate synthase component I [Candidatus Thioglobus sp. NP1]AXE62200.1 aminodeoxychorismate synthase, component I [Candidatus Thioglobus sp. NP1]
MKTIEIQKVDLASFCYLDNSRYPFLLESVNHNDNNRYSILFAFPGENIVLNNASDFDFLNKLESKYKLNNTNSDLPFCGGWFVYLSYELIGQIENTLSADLHNSDLPIAYAVKIPTAIIIDHQLDKTYIVDESNDDSRINLILDDIKLINLIPLSPLEGSLSEENQEKFISGVQSSLKYIIAGDVFQVNLSREWQYKLNNHVDSAAIYKSLKKANPAPFSALIHYQDFSIISSSPERLFSVNNDVLQTRPIAGTHPRGKGSDDETLKDNLISNPKEIAEHVMLLDLERNDMGRVCEYGSVFVNEVMTLETYPYVHHIVSNIKGKLKKQVGIKDIIKALFPGGTITGCPKVRCMQIISELEQMPREAYTGSVGYLSQNGRMDFNILIRSFIHKDNKLSFRAGAGIVYDSIPERELAETRHKAEGLIKVFKD